MRAQRIPPMRSSRFILLLVPLLTSLGSCGGGGGSAPGGSDQEAGSPPGSNENRGGGGESGGGSGEGGGEESGGGEGSGTVTASLSSWDQEEGQLRLTVDTAGGEVTLVTTEGDESDSVDILVDGTSEHSFSIPRRGTPLTERTMTVEAFDTNGQLLTLREIDVIEPMDLPEGHSMVALDLADIAELQSRICDVIL